VSAIFGVAVADRPRRLVLLAAILSGLWVFSGVLLAFVYLSVPGRILAGSLAAGIPRAFVVAWLVDRVLPRPVVAT
jgi:ABC-type Mn2+/Zn2+ transport system permease subunit